MATPCLCGQATATPVCDLTAGPGLDIDGSSGTFLITALDALPWTDYDPVTTANFTLGNGINGSRYLLNGKTLDLEILLRFGTTSTFSATEWEIGLPPGITPYFDPSGLNLGHTRGFASMRDVSSGTPWYEGDVFMRNVGLPLRVRFGDDAGGIADNSTVSQGNPFTWANGDELSLKLRIEVL